VIEIIKENIKGKNEADVEEVIKLLNQHLAQPDKPEAAVAGYLALVPCALPPIWRNSSSSSRPRRRRRSRPRKTIMNLSAK
jgi:hypothetical protein